MDPRQWDVAFPVVVAAMFVIVFCRAGGTYWLGRLAARGVRHTRISRLLEGAAYQTAARRINDYGAPVVALSFLTVGFQTVANFTAGAMLMPLTRYLPALVAGGIAWALLYSTLGTVGVNLFGRLWALSPALAIGLGFAVAAGLVGFALWRHRQPSED